MDEVKPVKQKEKIPWRIGFGLFLGVVGWFLPYAGLNVTLLPAQINSVDPVHKVQWIAMFATVAMIVAAIANLVAGALSDRTRTRFGKRTPWIVLGTLATVVLLFAISMSHTIPMLLLFWSLYQISLNCVVASVAALLADVVDPKLRGTVSTFMGIGTTVGNYGSGLIAAHFIVHIRVGIWVFALLAVIIEGLAIFLIKEPGNKEVARPEVKKLIDVVKMFSLPKKGAHDFYYALIGRFLMIAGTHMILGYQLYIFTDYMKLSSGETGSYIARMSSIMLIGGVICCFFAGPIADKIGHYKLPVVGTTITVAIGAVIPFFTPDPWTMMAFAVIAGFSMGVYNAVDQALLVSILPNKDEAAKDLGILNLANTVGNIMGPVLASTVISVLGYKFMFPAEAAVVLLSGFLISRIKGVK
ncbi:MFS transporter [Levilactobacillus sp. N40-8-2]|uniref:MFS transporter n=1 Tax=Levilactobacillus muriae TaxID=3238987 RepID=UPI0038B2C505